MRRYDTFWRLFAVIAAAWLPQILIRYPGVLMWDSYMQIKQFMGEAERISSHPPFGTLVYGCWPGWARPLATATLSILALPCSSAPPTSRC